MGAIEIGLGVALVVFAAALSPNAGIPSAAAQPLFATYAILWGVWAVRVALVVKPEIMSERYVVASGFVVTIPTLAVSFYFLTAQSDPTTALLVPFLVAVMFQSLFKSIEEQSTISGA